MNKNIKIEVAIGIILIITAIIGSFVWMDSKRQDKILTQGLKTSNNLHKACTQEAKICLDGTSVSRTGPNCEFTPCPEIKNIGKIIENAPKIIDLKKIGISPFGMEEFEIEVSNFKPLLWLCIQQDYYSKPSNQECNSGESINNNPYKFFANIQNHALLVLHSNSDSENGQKIFYDKVYISRIDNDNFQVSHSSELCGIVKRDEKNGSFFIQDQRLLTNPGWKDLMPFINKAVCVEGVQYQQSFRVYFIEEKN